MPQGEAKEGRANREVGGPRRQERMTTPILRFIPQKPRDGEEVALLGDKNKNGWGAEALHP